MITSTREIGKLLVRVAQNQAQNVAVSNAASNAAQSVSQAAAQVVQNQAPNVAVFQNALNAQTTMQLPDASIHTGSLVGDIVSGLHKQQNKWNDLIKELSIPGKLSLSEATRVHVEVTNVTLAADLATNVVSQGLQAFEGLIRMQ